MSQKEPNIKYDLIGGNANKATKSCSEILHNLLINYPNNQLPNDQAILPCPPSSPATVH